MYHILRISSLDLEKFEQIFQLERYETKDTAVKKKKVEIFTKCFDALCVYLKCTLFYEVFEKVYEGKEAGDFINGLEESLMDFEEEATDSG